MSEWINDLSKNALEVMERLGNFGATVNVNERMVKGYIMDSNTGEGYSTYYTSNHLMRIASACTEVADWLDKRADEGE